MINLNRFEYPKFTKVGVGHIDLIRDFCRKFPPYSDFNIISLICWNQNKTNSFSFLKGNLIIRINDYLSRDLVYSVMGDNRIELAVKELLGVVKYLKFVPEFVLSKLRSNGYCIEEDRDSFDYILDNERFSSLSGGVYKVARKKVKVFKHKFSNYEVRELNLSDKTDINNIIKLCYEWGISKNLDESSIRKDAESVRKFIHISKYFRTLSLGLYINDMLVAYTLNEILNGNWAMGHFGKSINSYDKGVFFLEYSTSKILNEVGCKYTNIQQDVGIQALRVAKNSYRPSTFLRKFTVSL